MAGFRGLLWSSLAVLAQLEGFVAGSSSSAPTVTLKNGTYVGFNDPTLNTDNFYGVAYAQPPVENLRYRPPQSLNTTWEGERDVTAWPKACMQINDGVSTDEMDEDCLYLAIQRPSNVTAEKLPVMVWLLQGGFAGGGIGWGGAFNQTWIVQRSADLGYPVIGVEVNSRVGPWGFLYSQEIQDSLNTNLGLRDMRKALEWIQENIEEFGGDPDRVTIQGQSTGAQSVGLQVLAYGGEGEVPFARAISESGAPVWFAPTASVELWQPTYNGIVEAAGCANATDNLQCLRELSNSTLYDILSNGTINPFGSNAPREYMVAVDGDFIPEPNSVLLQSGKFAKIDYLIGTNYDEGTTIGPKNINNTTQLNEYLVDEMLTIDDASLEMIGFLYPDIPSIGCPNTVIGRPDATTGYQAKRACAVGTDIIMDAPTRLTTLSMAAYNQTLYRYHFDVVAATSSAAMGATHGGEIPFTLYEVNYAANDTDNPLGGPRAAELRRMADVISAMWVSFATFGDPNTIVANMTFGDDFEVPNWPLYELPEPVNYVFTINESLHTAPDNFRAESINYLMDMMVASKSRNCTSIEACGGGYNITAGETTGIYWY